MRKLIYISLLLFLTTTLGAQNKLTNALYSLKHNELEKAQILIDAAAEDTLFTQKASTWYYRGYIYKEIFKNKESDDVFSPARDTAVSSFIKALEKKDVDEFKSSINSSLQFLAGTYYNHAAVLFTPQNHELALDRYNHFKDVMLIIDPMYDFSAKDNNFKLALASVYNELAVQNPDSEEVYTQKAADIYLEILMVDSNDVSANYNLGIYYYNKGVELVNNMDYSMDLYELNAVQDQMISFFKKSLPYMKKAYDLDPSRKETLEGLQGIYFGLNDKQKSDKYKEELDALNKKIDKRKEIDINEND